MNMKKVLAAVIAVMMALSAMAITAFAEEKVIDLVPSQTGKWGDFTHTVTIDIPVYGLYGYLTQDLKVNISGLGVIAPDNATDLKATINGYKLNKLADQVVWFGVTPHDYISDVYPTTLPQDTLVNGTGNLQIVVTYKTDVNTKNPYANADAIKASAGLVSYTFNGTELEAKAPAAAWAVNVATAENGGTWVNIMTPFGQAWDNIPNNDYTWIDLKWDHTLANKAAILGAETAAVKVAFNSWDLPNGHIVYNLWAKNYEAATSGWVNDETDWMNYKNARVLVDQVTVDGQANEVVFEVPLTVLYDATYGTWNTELVITFEASNIYNMLDETLKAVAGVTTAGSYGDLAWEKPNWEGKIATTYKGAALNYPTGAVATIVLTSADEVIEEVVDPVEPSTEEEEDETVPSDPVEEPEEEDTNPETGLALALVPMMVAAVAVVASKRR